MSDIVIAIVGLFGTILVAMLGLFGARKYNIGPNQERLVSTLKDLVDAQGERITQLETESKEREIQVLNMTLEITRLNTLVMSQLIKIHELELSLEKAKRKILELETTLEANKKCGGSSG